MTWFKIRKLSLVLALVVGFAAPTVLFPTLLQASGPTVSRAVQTRLDRLLAQRHRPTLRQLIQAMGNADVSRPFAEAPGIDDFLSDSVFESAPTIIATLEKVYPGGLYATLGRDAVFIADILEAFYLSHGAKERVVRLGASTSTITALQSNSQRLYDFLESNGFRSAQAASGVKPFVIIDRTSYGYNSQSTQLIRSIFNHAPVQHREGLWTNVGVASSVSGLPVQARSGLTNFHRAQGYEAGHAYPQQALRIPDMRPLTDRSHLVWHETFGGRMTTTPDGRTSGTPGRMMDIRDRRTTLNTMWQVWRLVNTREFQEAVLQRSRQFGVDLQSIVGTYDPRRFLSQEDMLTNVDWIENFLTENMARVIGVREFNHSVTPRDVKVAEALIVRQVEKTVEDFENSSNGLDLEEIAPEALTSALANAQIPMDQMRQQLNPQTRFGKFLVETLLMNSPLERGQDAGYFHSDEYFSPTNGQPVFDLAKTWTETYPRFTSADIREFLRILEETNKYRLITSRDLRRILLYVLYWSRSLTSREVIQIGRLIQSLPTIQRTLVEHREVFVTSRRNRYGAKRIYENLEQRGFFSSANACKGSFK